MGESILSQAEIDALLKEGPSTPEVSKDLGELLASIGAKVSSQLSAVFDHKAVISRPDIIIEDSELARHFHSDLYAIPLRFSLGTVLFLVSSPHTAGIAETLGTSVQKALQVVAQEWANSSADVLAHTTGKWVDAEVKEPAVIPYNKLGGLPLRGRHYLVRFDFSLLDQEGEFALMVPEVFTERIWPKPKTEASSTRRAASSAKQRQAEVEQPKVRSTSAFRRSPKVQERIAVEPFVFGDLQARQSDQNRQEIDLVNDVELKVIVELGRTTMKLGELMELKEQSIIRLEKIAGEPAELYINGNSIGKAEIMVLDTNFGARILEIVPSRERIRESEE